MECCHPSLTLDARDLTIAEKDMRQPCPDACQRLPLVLQVLRHLGPDLFIGPVLFERCMHLATVLLEASDSVELQAAIHASACALTMLSALKVSASHQHVMQTLFFIVVLTIIHVLRGSHMCGRYRLCGIQHCCCHCQACWKQEQNHSIHGIAVSYRRICKEICSFRGVVHHPSNELASAVGESTLVFRDTVDSPKATDSTDRVKRCFSFLFMRR